MLNAGVSLSTRVASSVGGREGAASGLWDSRGEMPCELRLPLKPGKGSESCNRLRPAGVFQPPGMGARALVGGRPPPWRTLCLIPSPWGHSAELVIFSLPGAVLVSGLFLPAQGAVSPPPACDYWFSRKQKGRAVQWGVPLSTPASSLLLRSPLLCSEGGDLEGLLRPSPLPWFSLLPPPPSPRRAAQLPRSSLRAQPRHARACQTWAPRRQKSPTPEAGR